jgi:hypothetical protein
LIALNHPLIAVPDVDAHQLAIEINEALSFRRPKINSPLNAPPEWDRRQIARTIQKVCDGDRVRRSLRPTWIQL